MRRTFQFACIVTVGVLLASFWAGCAEDKTGSLYDPNYQSRPAPTITAVSPVDYALAGVTNITITGSGFSTTAAENVVWFDGLKGTLQSATATQLVVTAPILVKDSVKLRVALFGAADFSNTWYYRLEPAVESMSAMDGKSEYATSLATDSSGNLYASLMTYTATTRAALGVFKITMAGTRTSYSPILSSAVGSWTSMKWGTGGAIFATAANRNIIFRIPPGGGTPGVFLSGGGLSNLNDLDFDAAGNIWAAGAGNKVFRVRTSDKNVKSFAFTGTIHSLRVYNNYVYVSALRDTLEKVWRMPIVSSDSLGVDEEFFDLSAIYGVGKVTANAITFTSDGAMFVGTTTSDGVILIHADKSWEPFYPGQFVPSVLSFAWATGPFLYAAQSAAPTGVQALYRINTQAASAPYYGQGL